MTSLRVVALSVYQPGFQLIADWARQHGHRVVLVVTLPGDPAHRYDDDARPLAPDLPPQIDVLITARLRSTAARVIAGVRPDLVISAGFPRLIPGEITSLPRYGALNLHPSPLPAGRGPNPIRLVYEGDSIVAATLHRTAAEFDTGAILSQRQRPLPTPLTGAAILAVWQEMLAEVLAEGADRAIAGSPGIPQDPAHATHAPAFTDAECRLDLTESGRTVVRKAAALTVLSPLARVRIDDADLRVREVRLVPDLPSAEPGTVLEKHADGWTVATGDAAVRLIT